MFIERSTRVCSLRRLLVLVGLAITGEIAWERNAGKNETRDWCMNGKMDEASQKAPAEGRVSYRSKIGLWNSHKHSKPMITASCWDKVMNQIVLPVRVPLGDIYSIDGTMRTIDEIKNIARDQTIWTTTAVSWPMISIFADFASRRCKIVLSRSSIDFFSFGSKNEQC